MPDFGRYIKEWTIQHGFSADQAEAEIDRWVAETRRKQDDFYRLGLAAFAEENFGKAHQLFLDSAGSNEKRMREAEQRFGEYREATVRDYRLAGDAAYNDYAFDRALDAYRRGLGYLDKEQHPRQWAKLTMDLAKAHYQIGIRTEGPVVQHHLAAAVSAYRAALEVRTREPLPQQWAATRNNLGIALREQSKRTGGEAGRQLLVEAVAAFRGALEIYRAAQASYYVQLVEGNLALTESFISAE